MDSIRDILISVEERHASNLIAGIKTVELRRKKVNVSEGTRVWIYSKLPRGEIQAVGIVRKVIADTPPNIWRSCGRESAITKPEFDNYFAGNAAAYAIIFQEVKPLAPILDLVSIRNRIAHFQPPQFFKKLACDSPELALFETAL
jgi:predicted transcriptional regulator